MVIDRSQLPRYCVVRHTIQALPYRSMLSSEFHRDKTDESNRFNLARLLRTSILILLISIAAPALYAQSTAIEPCQSTPTPKPGTAVIPSAPAKVGAKASQSVIDSSIPDDPAVGQLVGVYSERVKALGTVIGSLEGVLKRGGAGAGTMGNFVTDAMLAEARSKGVKNVALAIVNAGGLRKSEIAPGEIRASDIFELLPFENALITLDITGAQLSKLLLLTSRDAQSGARVQFKWNEQNRAEIIGAKLLDPAGVEHEIDSNGTYTIVTIDYLYKLKSGGYALLQEGKNLNWLNVTIRAAVIDYVKSEHAAGRPIQARLDNRFVQIGPSPGQ